MENTFYITTPIYYVNAAPHLGHAYTTIVADVWARYHRLRGKDVFFLTGTDEHGDKIAEAAAKAGMEPREYVDGISRQFRELWPKLKIANDSFIRTTDPNHVAAVRHILQKVYDAGDIYFGRYGGHYCVGCERFYMEKELVDGLCPDHLRPPEYREEENYFFRMGKYQDWLVEHLKAHPDFIRPERYRNEVLAFLREPLEDLCISRPKSRLTWGITLPFDENYVTYVWFDALINYVSVFDYPDGEGFGRYWPAANHLIAKDILKPHGIYWPTMLKAAGIEPYQHLNVHGYWVVDQSKMSKAVGNIVKPLDLKDKYGLDAFRYYLLRDMVFGLDAGFSEEAMIKRVNSDLANDLGNLVSRCLTMAHKYFQGRVPERPDFREDDNGLARVAAETKKNYEEAWSELATHKALMVIWEFISHANKFIVTTEPWMLARSEDKRQLLAKVIYDVLEALRFIAVLLEPFLPDTAEKMFANLGWPRRDKDFDAAAQWGVLPSGGEIILGEPLFPRIEAEKPATVTTTFAAPEKALPEITYEDFARLDLRVARVTAASRVPKSKKLVELEVECPEKRTIVAGIGADYSPEELVGKSIVLLANLQPARLMGIESRGMLLAAPGEEKLALLTFDRPPQVGGKIK